MRTPELLLDPPIMMLQILHRVWMNYGEKLDRTVWIVLSAIIMEKWLAQPNFREGSPIPDELAEIIDYESETFFRASKARQTEICQEWLHGRLAR